MFLAVSIDLDEMHHYGALHGLPPESCEPRIYDVAVPRLTAWARQRSIPLTWFIVGADMLNERSAETVKNVGRQGDELASHSFEHRYDLSRLPMAEIADDLERSCKALRDVSGQKPRGFRAPGYVVTDALLALLVDHGFQYDASVFPSAPYQAAKALMLGKLLAQGRKSVAVLDHPGVSSAPIGPYRVGRPYWTRGNGILEIPVQVTPGVRLPFIGTALTLARPLGARLLAQSICGQPFVNLELHAIDALDSRDGLEVLSRHQRDLRVPWTKKLEAIDSAISLLRQKGYACVRMDELAARAASA